METLIEALPPSRYKIVTEEKAGGATYTPKCLADFVSKQICCAANVLRGSKITVLDPAMGDGELLISLLEHLNMTNCSIEAHGFETDIKAINKAKNRIQVRFPNVSIHVTHGNFLESVIQMDKGSLFESEATSYDLIIANPPYVRTQIMGAKQAQLLANQFKLTGRVDLYYAFLVGISYVLKPGGVAGIIVSNRFMTTKSGGPVRQALREHFKVKHVWDLGDTKLFDAAVLPAVMLVEKNDGYQRMSADFTSIYTCTDRPTQQATDVIAALSCEGVVEIKDGRRFTVTNGKLDISAAANAVWRVATEANDHWLATVEANTWRRFGDVGKIRVGVKTCADKVFIRNDWDEMLPSERPELLRDLTTHHIARRFRAADKKMRRILYPHEIANSQRMPVNLEAHPKSLAYLERHRSTLEGRSYVLEAGRKWYEIWVPQDPSAWAAPKLVFRDISEEPNFWIDLEGSIVNGDCYWLITESSEDQDLLWLALAVANSSFIEDFYDHSFKNKLYAGRRRFITQYVERFPLPKPTLPISIEIIDLAKKIYHHIGTDKADSLAAKLNLLIWQAFGLPIKKIGG